MVFRPGRRRHGGTTRPGAGYRLIRLTRLALLQVAEVYFGQLNFDYACFDVDRSTQAGSPVDRDAEWRGLVSFAADARPGATLGVVSGRRRQGKSYLLQALTAAAGGIYFPALEVTEAVSLRLFADELIRFTGAPVRPFRDWLEAIPYLFQLAA